MNAEPGVVEAISPAASKRNPVQSKHNIPVVSILGNKVAKKKFEYFPLPDIKTMIVPNVTTTTTTAKGKMPSKVPAVKQPDEVEPLIEQTAAATIGKAGKKLKKKQLAIAEEAHPAAAAFGKAGKKQAKVTEEEVPLIDQPTATAIGKAGKKHAKKQLPIVEDAPIEQPVVPVLGKAAGKKAKKAKQTAINLPLSSEPELPHGRKPNQLLILAAASAAAADKPAKKKRSQVDAAFESNVSTELAAAPVSKKFKSSKTEAPAPVKAKKRLNILNSSSEAENATAGTSAAAAAAPDNYKIHQIRSMPLSSNNATSKTKKRKTADIREKATAPKKPQWTSAGTFFVSKVPHQQSENVLLDRHVASSSGSDFIVTSLSKKRRLNKHGDFVGTAVSPAERPAAVELAQFRERAQFDKGVQRESAKQLLQRKQKQRANAGV